jgi:hypothetical protein
MTPRRFGPVVQLAVGGVLLLAFWALLVWVSARPALKALIDLTPQQVNSIDPASEDLLQELRGRKADIEFHLFYPPYAGAATDDWKRQEFRIRDRLRELTRLLLVRYQFLGGESVKIVAHDFYADTQRTREDAQAFGYTDAESDVLVVAVRLPGRERRFRKLSLPLDLGQIERPNQGAAPLARGSLPVLKRFVGEEQISSALKGLLVEGTPVAYLLRDFSPLLSLGEVAHGYSGFLAALAKSGFDVRDWRTSQQAGVPDDAALVIVLEPTADFPERTAQALFDYLRRGGRLLLNHAWSPLPDGNGDGGRLGELLGFELSRQPVFHLIRETTGRTAGRGLDGDPAVAKLQMFVNPLHPTTRRLAQSGRPMELATARAVRERPGAPAQVRREALLRTGDQGWLAVTGSDGYPSFRAPGAALQSFDVAMACEIDVAPDAVRPNGPKTGQAVVVGGVFCNNAGMALFGDLALNVCNWMAERKALMDLKAPGYEAKYLTLQPQQLARIGWFVVWGVPGAFLLVGVLVFLRRRQ